MKHLKLKKDLKKEINEQNKNKHNRKAKKMMKKNQMSTISKKEEEDLRIIIALDMFLRTFIGEALALLSMLITILILPHWPKGLGN